MGTLKWREVGQIGLDDAQTASLSATLCGLLQETLDGNLVGWEGIRLLLVVALALTSVRIYPGLAKQLLVAALRTAIQLTLIGLVLKTLFAHSSLMWVAVLSGVMLAVAGREVVVRQQRRFAGGWGYAIGTVSMFTSSFTVALFALIVVVGSKAWKLDPKKLKVLGAVEGK